MYNLLHKILLYFKFSNSPIKDYLTLQLQRTLTNKNRASKRVEKLIDILTSIKKFNSSEKALFVGCRNTHEICYFKKKNRAEAIGIDLFSESNLVRIMDMHDMKFSDNYFDIIFASHSLEHSYNPQAAINEFIRVAKDVFWVVIEVPINYKVQGADLIDFRNEKQILKLFSKVKMEVKYKKILRKDNPQNSSGTDTLSLILRIQKN